MPDLPKFSGATLRQARMVLGLSQADLAQRVGLANPDTIRRWEKGESEPSATYLIRLSAVLCSAWREVAQEHHCPYRSVLSFAEGSRPTKPTPRLQTFCFRCQKSLKGAGTTGVCTSCHNRRIHAEERERRAVES